MSVQRAVWVLALVCTFPKGVLSEPTESVLRAGASALEIDPTVFPTNIAGGFLDSPAIAQADHLRSRCMALDDGHERIVIVIVDSTNLPRDLLDRIKDSAAAKAQIRTDRILIAATHTHSASSTGGGHASADPHYSPILLEKIPECIAQAVRNLEPARIGWTVIQDWEHTHTRSWLRRPDKVDLDPLGQRNVRANMHPGFQNPDVLGPAGPSDPDIAVLAIQARNGRPIAMLANYSQHYYGPPTLVDGSILVSADYFGRVDERIATLIREGRTPEVSRGFNSSAFGLDSDTPASHESRIGGDVTPPFVAMLSQGTSGDQMWMDYSRKPYAPGLDGYSDAIAQQIFSAYRSIRYRDDVSLAMVQRELSVGSRQPTAEELSRARKIVAAMKGGPPRTISQAYALSVTRERPATRELQLQAIRIGELAITAIPAEVYAITGLKIKAKSPLPTTVNLGLANGYQGYIPPPEQHVLGGYTTWKFYNALAPQAEPQIVATILELLEEASGQKRRPVPDTNGTYATAVLDDQPLAYWRLNEFSGPLAKDATGRGNDARYEDERGVAFYLPGPDSEAFSGAQVINRAPHLAGGRIRSDLNLPADRYSAELWFWNALPANARGVTGWLFANGAGDSIGIGGTAVASGKLIFANGKQAVIAGTTTIPEKTWNHLVLVREGSKVSLFLNGRETPEISVISPVMKPQRGAAIFLGGRADPNDSFEGKIDEVVLYDRALSPLEISDRFRLAGSLGKSNQ